MAIHCRAVKNSLRGTPRNGPNSNFQRYIGNFMSYRDQVPTKTLYGTFRLKME